MALTDKLVAIADAIREKTGKTDKMTLNQMAVEINEIASGNTEVEDALLTGTLTSYENDRITELGRYGLQGKPLLETVSLPNLVKTPNRSWWGFTLKRFENDQLSTNAIG